MNMKNKIKQKGFGELLTSLVSLGIAVTIISLVTPYVLSTIEQKNRIEGESNLQILGKTIEGWYEDNSWYIDSNNSSELKYKDNSGKEYEIKGDNYTDQESIRKIAKKYNGNDNIVMNGFKSSFKIFVSNRLNVSVDNILVPYHVFAIVDKGEKTNYESTFDKTTGELVLGAGESGVTVSGYDIEKNIFDKSKKRMNYISDAYKSFYYSRYMGHGYEFSRNYFGSYGTSESWDKDSPVKAICVSNENGVVGVNISETNLTNELSLQNSSYKTLWGNEYTVLNCGYSKNIPQAYGNVDVFARTPNSDSTSRIPPYTAIIGFKLPNNQVYMDTIISTN